MTTIQAILILFSLLAAIFSSLIFRWRLAYRLLAIFLFATASSFVISPDTTTVIAHHLGVGRGTDLLLYVSLFAGVHGFLLLYLRTRNLERKITDQIRSVAISQAQNLQEISDSNSIDPPLSQAAKAGR